MSNCFTSSMMTDARELLRLAKVEVCGMCFRTAYRYVMDHSGTELVHGRYQDDFGRKVKNHAWVEKGNKLIDPEWGGKWIDKRKLKQGGFLYIEEARYTDEEAMITMVRNRHMGPWHR